MSGGNLKLKLNTNTAQPSASSPSSALPTPTLKLNLSRRPSEVVTASPSQAQTPSAAPKLSRKNTNASNASPATSKKRKQSDAPEAATAKKSKLGPIRLGSQSGPSKPLIRKGSILKLGKGASNALQSPTTPGGGQVRALRVKHKGKLPPRPLGVGYDSEADEAEEDPAIEENFVLRMLPGPDCDYVRNAIEERKIGVPISQGGADVSLRFFTKDARRAVLKVRDKLYSAVLVDLPCIVETMKSWDRKGWWKTADICQMLLVTEQVANEDAARNTPLPKELDTKTWQWPHGLTPPMHNVRKRRFRKRLSHKTIEQAELEVERLLEADEHATAHGGSTHNEILDWEQLRREEEGVDDEQGNDDEEDADGDIDMDANGYANEQAIDDDDDADWQAQFEAQLGADDDDEPETASGTPAALPTTDGSQAPTPTAEAETPSADAQQLLQDEDTQPQTPADASGSSDEDEDDEDDDEDEEEEEEEEEEIDEEAREKQQYLAQQREEIAHLERQIADRREQVVHQKNAMIRQRLVATIKRFEEERDVKKRGLGDRDDDD